MVHETKKQLSEIILAFKKQLADVVDSRRISNPDIKKSGNTFTMKASNLSLVSWDPFYYDFDAQFDYILKKLDKQSVDTFCNTLDTIVKTGSCDGRKFHPDVVASLSNL